MKKNKPKEPAKLSKKASIDEKRTYNAQMLAYDSEKKSYEGSMVELKVLSSNKAYNYFKKSWKMSLVDGDMEAAKRLLANIAVHLDANQQCIDCLWHEIGDDYVQSFGPFTSAAALKVIQLWIEKYIADEMLAKYINSETTNYNEYVNSLEGYFNLKIKSLSDASYDTFAFYTSALANLGPVVDQRVVQELGLPWEPTQQLLLSQRIDAHEKNSQRKKSDSYLTARAEHRQKRKDDTEAGRKDQNYKSVKLAKETDANYKRAINSEMPLLYSLDDSTKRRKIGNFVGGDLVFVKFGSHWFYGVVLLRFEDESEMYFIDSDVKREANFELKSVDFMKPDFPVWVPKDLRESRKETTSFSSFQPHLPRFAKCLSDFYAAYIVKTSGI